MNTGQCRFHGGGLQKHICPERREWIVRMVMQLDVGVGKCFLYECALQVLHAH